MGTRELGRLRGICLALPDTHEELTWESPNFRVGRKIFAMAAPDGTTMSLKADPDEKHALLAQGDDRYFRPHYVDSKGWVGIRLDRGTDWTEIEELVTTSWSLIAPKRLVKAHLGA